MNTFTTAIPSRYSRQEICLKPFELEDTMFHQSHRVVENRAIRHIDHNPALLKYIKTMGEKERKENRSRLLQSLKKRHQAYLADTRKALSDCHSKRALYVLIDEMAEHDKALAARAGRDFCDTFAELEVQILQTEARINQARQTLEERAKTHKSLPKTATQKPDKLTSGINKSLNTFPHLAAYGWNTRKPAQVG